MHAIENSNVFTDDTHRTPWVSSDVGFFKTNPRHAHVFTMRDFALGRSDHVFTPLETGPRKNFHRGRWTAKLPVACTRASIFEGL